MRTIGTRAYAIRLPIINEGDDLARIAADSIIKALNTEKITLTANDIVGVTEAVVARAQGNYAETADVAYDIESKFGKTDIGLVFPIMSRNRFLNILKGIAKGANKVYVLLKYPQDEVGNPILNADAFNRREITGMYTAAEFKRKTGGYVHPFTGVDYIEMYENAADNISVYLSDDPLDILKLTKEVLVCEIHTRHITRSRLLSAGADKVYTLCSVLAEKSSMHGYNPDFGVLGSNMANGGRLKLFPRECDIFIDKLREYLEKETGTAPEALVYGDGAFKDPIAGIWELADPVVSPAHTPRLSGRPDEIKLKYVADELSSYTPDRQREALLNVIGNKQETGFMSEGTTPRKYSDLLGSLCDLLSGSGDKGTPVILIQGYFDNYADQ